MVGFGFDVDLEIVMDLLNISADEIAENIGVTPMTISRWLQNESQASRSNKDGFYNFGFAHGIMLNKIKEQLAKEECPNDSIILFHGAKTYIDGKITLDRSKLTNDLGKGFYCGTSLEQSAMFVSTYQEPSLYILSFKKDDLKHIKLNVDRDWMLMIAYFRKRLGQYSDHPIIQDLLKKLVNVDYIIAPIADNQMFEIIDSFINGEITDIQCQHCLSATDLGDQYVFITQRSLDNITILKRCYLSPSEKRYYISHKQESSRIGNDKVKVARKQYRNQGQYIEDILK